MSRTSYAQGRISPVNAPSEYDVVWTTPTMLDRPSSTDGVLYFHGSGNTADTVFNETIQHDLLDKISKHSVVIHADFGLQAWGNLLATKIAKDAMDYGEANLGVTGKWTLVGGSMGNANQFATALAYPNRIKGIAGMIPLIDIVDIMGRGAASSVNLAYPPAYNDATDGPNHNPIHMASTLPASMPIHLWCSDDDPLVPISIAVNFVSLRPQTSITHLGNLGHTNAAIGAAAPDVIKFVRSLTPAGV